MLALLNKAHLGKSSEADLEALKKMLDEAPKQHHKALKDLKAYISIRLEQQKIKEAVKYEENKRRADNKGDE